MVHSLMLTAFIALPSAGTLIPSEPPPPPITTRRTCDDGTATARCFARARLAANGEILARKAAPVSGYTPIDIQAAYNIDPTVETTATVALVDAFDSPNAEADLAVYRAYFGLPPCTTANGCFRKVNQTGSATSLPPLPGKSDDWTVEIALDLDAVSAACPHCKILLLEADNDFEIPGTYNLNLAIAQNTAARLGATVISNSWGGSEFIGQQLADATFFNHPGVAIFASAGDAGYQVEWPATAPNVIAVGGTTLIQDSSPRGFTEIAWAGTGGGCSAYESRPDYQTGKVSGCDKREINDLSAVADPNTGLAVYDTSNGNKGWMDVGGTSLSSPLVAAIFAETGNGEATPAFVYANASKFNDVSVGKDGKCSPAILCTAGPAWDAPTGVGTPNAALLTAAASTEPSPGSGGGGGCTFGDLWSGLGQLAAFIPMQMMRARRYRKRGVQTLV